MTVLPSGVVVGVTSERARYHATRRQLRVTRDTPHRDLYPLVDIVYADARHRPESWARNYRFTGHTLSDRGWLAKWKPADRERFLAWLEQPGPTREIEGARRKLLHDSLPHQVRTYDYPERLYSALHRHLAAVPMEAAHPEQWRSTILNLRQRGVRGEEIEWSGVLGFLDAMEAGGRSRVPRADLLSRVDFTDIRLELTNELVHGDQCPLTFEDRARLLGGVPLRRAGLETAGDEQAVVRLVDRLLGYRIGYIRATGEHGRGPRRWFVLDPYGHALTDAEGYRVLYRPDAAAARRVAGDHARVRYGVKTGLRPHNKFEYMSLHGGGDYREWLVTLPDYQRSHFTPHFTERNILVHFRTKTRHDPRGRPLLFVEEIQSDWHQQAASRQHPWQERIPDAPFRKEWGLLALKLLLLHAVEEGHAGLAWAPGTVQRMRYGHPLGPVQRLYDRTLGDALRHLARDWDGTMTETAIRTKEPWLHPKRVGDHWAVTDKAGRFATRGRLSREGAMAVCDRHSKTVDLAVPAFYIPGPMREAIARDGLPLFGERLVAEA
ncbi:MAG TPA: hypothetical protein VKA64_05870 [Gammaproteobacteria bacterium]|nr:hypothetical protein [Gammaproteobacteria bacterium]